MTGRYFLENFQSTFYSVRENIYSDYFGQTKPVLNTFIPFVRSMEVVVGSLDVFQTNDFNSLKELQIVSKFMRSVDSLRSVLPNVESLTFIYCELDRDFDESILQHCEKLKRLHVRDSLCIPSTSEYFHWHNK